MHHATCFAAAFASSSVQPRSKAFFLATWYAELFLLAFAFFAASSLSSALLRLRLLLLSDLVLLFFLVALALGVAAAVLFCLGFVGLPAAGFSWPFRFSSTPE